MSNPIRFAIVGTGWRSGFFQRLAAAVPDRLEVVAVVGRTPERAHQSAQPWGNHAAADLDEAKARGAEFIAVAVPWDVNPGVMRACVERGLPVLAETPPAQDADGLTALWDAVGASGLIQVAEQYTRMPGHAARIAVARQGVIGEVSAVQLSSTHLYHAVSIIRATLGAAAEPGRALDDMAPGASAPTEARVTGHAFTAPMVNPIDRDGWRGGSLEAAQSAEPLTTTLATLDFGDGRYGLYDFVDNQWWNPLLHRRVVVRGERGEIDGDHVMRLTGEGPVASRLEWRRTGIDLNLEGNDVIHASFDGQVVYRNPWTGTAMSEDDLAVATILEDMGRWTRGEAPEPYPLAQACWDHALALAMRDAAQQGREVVVGRQAWS